MQEGRGKPLERVQQRDGGDGEAGERDQRDERHEAHDLEQPAVFEAVAIGKDVIDPLGMDDRHDEQVNRKDPATASRRFSVKEAHSALRLGRNNVVGR